MLFWSLVTIVPTVALGYLWLLEHQTVWIPKLLSSWSATQTWWKKTCDAMFFKNLYYVVLMNDIHGFVCKYEKTPLVLSNPGLPYSWVFDFSKQTLYKTPLSCSETPSHCRLPYLAGTLRAIYTDGPTITHDISDFLTSIRVEYPSNTEQPSVAPNILLECYDIYLKGRRRVYYLDTKLYLDVITEDGDDITFNLHTNEIVTENDEEEEGNTEIVPRTEETSETEQQSEQQTDSVQPTDTESGTDTELEEPNTESHTNTIMETDHLE